MDAFTLRLAAIGSVTVACLFALSLLIRLREEGMDPLDAFTRLVRRPVSELALLLFFIGGFVQYGATKGTNGMDRGQSAPILRSAPCVTPVAVDSDGFAVPTNAPPVTNLCFWGIERGSNSVAFGMAWPETVSFTNGLIDLFGHWELVTNGWSHLAEIDVSEAESNAVFEIDVEAMPTNMESVAFFRLASQDDSDGDGLSDSFEEWTLGTNPLVADSDGDGLLDGYELSSGTDPFDADTDGDGLTDGEERSYGLNPRNADTDGDGLPDGEELGYIKKSETFEWRGTDGFTPTYNTGYRFEDPPGIMGWWCAAAPYPLSPRPVVTGLLLYQVMLFETGYISFSSTQDFYAWIYPPPPRSLDGDIMNTGSIMVAAYWSNTYLCNGDTNSYMRAGVVGDGTSVVEFHDVRLEPYSPVGMTYQVIVPPGTGTVIKVSYLESDFWMAGSNAVVGVQNKRIRNGNRYYNLTWNFQERGPILPLTTVEYHLGYGTNPLVADTDGDGLTDGFEVNVFGSMPASSDSDGDGLDDGVEFQLGTNPVLDDTDMDGLLDAWEVIHNLDPCDSSGDDGANGDVDGDGLTNLMEEYRGTDPWDADTDDDGLLDGDEVYVHGSNPLRVDTDGDGLSDGDEINLYGSSPSHADTDGDGLADPEELILGTNPSRADTDGDGLRDADELNTHGTDPLDSDTDGDGLSDGAEINTHGTDPLDTDTDGDGLVDGNEVNVYGTNPLSADIGDSDLDGLTDAEELLMGTNPHEPDSDGDGMDDGWEARYAGAGFNPMVVNNASADPDGDGLTNAQECECGSNPSGLDEDDDGIPDGYDSDGDGVGDGAEVAQSSDPGDASDGGAANSRISVPFRFGDPSGSHSEKYVLTVSPVSVGGYAPRSFSWLNAYYGQCETKIAMLKPGWKYEVRLYHASTNRSGAGYPDYDYQLDFGGSDAPHNVILDDRDGLFDGCDNGAVFTAAGKVACVYVLASPRLVANYDRDDDIDSDDEAAHDCGATLRFWVNDDNDSGDVNDSENDRPGSGANGQDNVVNGHGDLLDFTPLLIDMSGVIPTSMPAAMKSRISWRLESDSVNAVWTGLSADEAGLFQREDCGTVYGPSLSQSAHMATVTNLSGGVAMPAAFVSHMAASGDKGVILIEGRAAGTNLVLRGYLDNSTSAFIEGRLNLGVSPVEDMYNHVSLRGAVSSTNFTASIPPAPTNMIDNVKSLDIFFLHGFNVSEQASRAWGAEVFKRLWQAGSNARFWSLTWAGDYNWLGSTFNGLHYHQDVYHALKTGAALKSFVELAQTNSAQRILMAHSLGNMVACEALRQNLLVGKYFMFNAAVASEAVDGTLQNFGAETTAKYVPSDWSDYNPLSWAANWYGWFASNPNDARGRMGWPDYFSNALGHATTVYNYYSSGDPIFAESSTVPGLAAGVFHWPTLSWSWPFVNIAITTEDGSWQKQETRKGVDPLVGTLSGGWGFNCWYENIGNQQVQVRYSASEANAMVQNGSITNNPVFSCSGTPMNNPNATQDDVWLSLAKYVSAVSSPVGGTAVYSTSEYAIDMNTTSDNGILRPNGWGRMHNVYNAAWLHSDMKDMAYFFVYKLYEQISTKGNIKDETH